MKQAQNFARFKFNRDKHNVVLHYGGKIFFIILLYEGLSTFFYEKMEAK